MNCYSEQGSKGMLKKKALVSWVIPHKLFKKVNYWHRAPGSTPWAVLSFPA